MRTCALPAGFEKALEAANSCYVEANEKISNRKRREQGRFGLIFRGFRRRSRYVPSWQEKENQRCHELTRKLLTEAGAEYIGHGAFRMSFGFTDHDGNRCIIKTPEHKGLTEFVNDGYEHNLIEAETWEDAPEELKRYLTPVSDYDANGLWLTMPRERAGYDLPPTERENLSLWLNRHLNEMGYDCPDLHSFNVGISARDDGPIAIDYGFGCTLIKPKRRWVPSYGDDSIVEDITDYSDQDLADLTPEETARIGRNYEEAMGY